MNTFDIIAILAILALGYLYWTTRNKLKKLDDVKIKLVEYLQVEPNDYTSRRTLDQMINSLVIMDSNKDLKIESLHQTIKDGREESDKLKKIILDLKADIQARSNITQGHLAELDELRKKLETPVSLTSIASSGPSEDVKGILATHEGFAQSADISPWEIRMNAKDLISEEYINVIKGLHKISLFPLNLQQDYNFDPKSLAVKIDLINKDENGEDTSFKSWSDFLYERNRFIKVISSYVESVINQRRINQAVDLALNGTEVASV